MGDGPFSLVGSPVAWTATTSDHGESPVYQFSVGQLGEALTVVRDFSPDNSFRWSPMDEGDHEVRVTVKESFSAEVSESESEIYTAESRVVGDEAVIRPRENPRPVGSASRFFDVDGDLGADLLVYDTDTATWVITYADGRQETKLFGAPRDVGIPGDYDGDGVTDLAVFRPVSDILPGTSHWFAVLSGGGVINQAFGAAGDEAVPADYDGDGVTDMAVYRRESDLLPGAAHWFAVLSGGGVINQAFGAPGDDAIPADYDGDGITDLAVYRQESDILPGAAHWFATLSLGGVINQPFGGTEDMAIPGDYDGDGKSDLVVFRNDSDLVPGASHWLGTLSGGGILNQAFGGPWDDPAPADHDGDGITDPAVYRPQSSEAFLLQSHDQALALAFDNMGLGLRTRLLGPLWLPIEAEGRRSISLTNSGPADSLVGSPVTWTAGSSGFGDSAVYQFRVGQVGGPSSVVRDFSVSNSFTWTPMQEGDFWVQVVVKAGFNSETSDSTSANYNAISRVVGSEATVSPTSNPLVALYSAPSSEGGTMFVEFRPLGSDGPWSKTDALPIESGLSTNFLVAGMLADATYEMRHVIDDGSASAAIAFTTGALPTNLNFPSFSIDQAPTDEADLTQNLVVHFGLLQPPGTINTLATDRDGNIAWYFDSVAQAFPNIGLSIAPGGSVLLASYQDGHRLREVDLAGNTIWETNIGAVNAQLAKLGQDSIVSFHHDAERLPNGKTAVLANGLRTIDVDGTPTEYLGDMVLVFNENLEVEWVWDAFDWLDTNRLPINGDFGPEDWMHSNAVSWSPADGNLVISVRHQNWVIKIDYANGTGDGHVVWRLGEDGDFTLNSSDPSPWFSYQHDANYVDNTTLIIFDNGNTRRLLDDEAHSRGQAFVLDEAMMQASLVLNADLGGFAVALGSAQRLPNGNFVFNSGIEAHTIEVLPDESTAFQQTMAIQGRGLQYRSYIYDTLYGRPTWSEG